ncbi:MAG: hypothetical protein U9Q92_02660 [archaeon]|nr:hypothetical protein [archaeon]
MFGKISILIIIISIIFLSGCTKLQEVPPTKTTENKIGGNQILVNSFHFIYEEWTPGNSGHIFSKIIVFNLSGKEIALINRRGLIGRNDLEGILGERICEGKTIHYGDGKYGTDLETIIGSECSLEYGDGKFCEFFMSGKCLLSCKRVQTIEITNMDKINECLTSAETDVILNILKEGIAIHDLNLDSPCSFYNGEFLKLVE